MQPAGFVEGVRLIAASPAGSAPGGPSEPVNSGIGALTQSAKARWQRGAKRQPGKSSPGCGGEPGMASPSVRGPPTWAKPESSRSVYGCCGEARTSRTGPCSAICPAYMIATRSQVSAITERSCVISRSARPRSRRSSSSSCRIWPWVITSSAVVGSSPMISSGPQASASAIMTRCRMPPENSCGYWLAPRRRNADALEQLGDARIGDRCRGRAGRSPRRSAGRCA